VIFAVIFAQMTEKDCVKERQYLALDSEKTALCNIVRPSEQ